MKYYILDEEKKAVCVSSDEYFEWAKKQPEQYNVVAKDSVGDYKVSTIFLYGIDHGYSEADPLLWETMIFGLPDEHDEYQERYSSYEAAVEGHKKAVEYAKTIIPASLN